MDQFSNMSQYYSYSKLKASNPDKYPSRMGEPWDKDEISQLLNLSKRKMPIQDIADTHDRTKGAIRAKLQEIAYKMYVDHKLAKDIIFTTGLTSVDLERLIKRREKAAKPVLPVKTKEVKNNPTIAEVYAMLMDIQTKVDWLIERVA